MKDYIKKVIDKIWVVNRSNDYEELLFSQSKPFESEIPQFLDSSINQSFKRDNEYHFHGQFIRKYLGNIFIEPDYLFCIRNFNEIIESSISIIQLPSFPRYLRSKFSRTTQLPRAIILDGQLGVNYFHFYSDVLGKLWLIKKIDNYSDIPILVSSKVFNTKHFQYALKSHFFQGLNILVPHNSQYIVTKELYLLSALPYDNCSFKKVAAQFKHDLPSAIPTRRIFLNRQRNSGRNISNFESIIPILEKYEFEIVETENMSLTEQIQLFQSAKELISIHGAGNINIIFSDERLKFLEIMPASRIACQYYWLSKTLKISYYDCILGGNLEMSSNEDKTSFILEPLKLENAIIALLKN
jgi:hypothetical protein